MVRRPEAERESEYDVESLVLTTPGGGEIPLPVAAKVDRGRAYTSIERAEGQRVITVTADVDAGTNAQEVLSDLKRGILPEIVGRLSRDGGQLRGRLQSGRPSRWTA